MRLLRFVVASVVVVGADDDVMDSAVDDMAAVVATAVAFVVVVGAVHDVMDSAIDDVAACRYFCGIWWCR